MEEPVAEEPVAEEPVVEELSASFMMAVSNSFALPISTTHTIIGYIARPRASSPRTDKSGPDPCTPHTALKPSLSHLSLIDPFCPHSRGTVGLAFFS